MKKLLLPVVMLMSLSTFAQNEKGNGGDAVVCQNGEVILLDKYEAKKRNFQLEIIGTTLREKVQTLTERLKSLDEFNGKIVEKLALEMVEDFEIGETDRSNMRLIRLSSDILSDIDDSLETSLPNGCKKEQLIINKKVVYTSDTKFEIREDLWDKMSLEDQAMAVMHESIYNWLIEAEAVDSRFARYLNGYLSQKTSALNYLTYVSGLIQTYKQGIKINFIPQGMKKVDSSRSALSKMGTYEGYLVFVASIVSPLISEYCFGTDCIDQRISQAIWNNNGQLDSQEFRLDCMSGTTNTTNGSIKFAGCNGEYTWQDKSLVIKTYGSKQVASIKSEDGIRSVIFNGKKYSNVKKVYFTEKGEISNVE